MNRSTNYVSERQNYKSAWNQNDVYFIMDLLNEDYSKIPEYFPRTDGREMRKHNLQGTNVKEVLTAIMESALEKLAIGGD